MDDYNLVYLIMHIMNILHTNRVKNIYYKMILKTNTDIVRTRKAIKTIINNK